MMGCKLLDVEPLSKPMMSYCYLSWEQISRKFVSKYHNFQWNTWVRKCDLFNNMTCMVFSRWNGICQFLWSCHFKIHSVSGQCRLISQATAYIIVVEVNGSNFNSGKAFRMIYELLLHNSLSTESPCLPLIYIPFPHPESRSATCHQQPPMK